MRIYAHISESEGLMGGNNKEKNLIKNTLLFTVGNVGAKLLMLIIVPLLIIAALIESYLTPLLINFAI